MRSPANTVVGMRSWTGRNALHPSGIKRRRLNGTKRLDALKVTRPGACNGGAQRSPCQDVRSYTAHIALTSTFRPGQILRRKTSPIAPLRHNYKRWTRALQHFFAAVVNPPGGGGFGKPACCNDQGRCHEVADRPRARPMFKQEEPPQLLPHREWGNWGLADS